MLIPLRLYTRLRSLCFLALIQALLLTGWPTWAYTVNPATCTSNSAYINKLRLNEVKSQGGGSGLDFVEVYTIADGVNLSGFKIGVSGYSGTPKSPWVESGGIATIPLGAGHGCVDYTGNANSFTSCATKDLSGTTWNYGRYILYDLPNMSQHGGQIVLLDNAGKIVDFLAYSSSTTCDTAQYWAPPTSGSSCYNVNNCATSIASSNADISRNTDGTGTWTSQGSTSGTQGSSNTTGGSTPPPSGGVGYKFIFSASGATITISAVWINKDGTFLSGNPTYTAASGRINVSTTNAGISLSTTTPVLINGITSVDVCTTSSTSTPTTINLTAINSVIPGTETTNSVTPPPTPSLCVRKTPYLYLRERY